MNGVVPHTARNTVMLLAELVPAVVPAEMDIAVWSPFDAFAAAQVLDDALRADLVLADRYNGGTPPTP